MLQFNEFQVVFVSSCVKISCLDVIGMEKAVGVNKNVTIVARTAGSMVGMQKKQPK